MVEASLSRIGRPPASAGKPSNSLSRLLITTRTLGNSALRSPLAMLRKCLSSTEPGTILRRASVFVPAASRSRHPASSPRSGRRRRRLRPRTVRRRRPNQSATSHCSCWPRRQKRTSRKSSSGASISTRCPSTAPVGVADLRVRQLDEVGVLEHLVEGLHEVAVAALARRAVERGMRLDLGAEIVIVVAQPLERLEIFVVIDRRQHVAEPAELSRPRRFCRRLARPEPTGCRSCGPE